MYFSFGTLSLLCLFAVIAWLWYEELRVREFANVAAMEACRRMGLQFLDGTAAFARLSLTRDGGSLRIRRTYVFDYTAQSIERRQGFVILTGAAVDYVGFAPEHTAQPRPPEPTAPRADEVISQPASPASGSPSKTNVFDLNARRAQRAVQAEESPQRDRNP